MTESAQPTRTKSAACPLSGSGFNYCFWAKAIVAVPALPILSYGAASLFQEPALQIIAGSGVVMAAVYGAIKLDNIPALQKKVVACKSTEAES